MLTKRSGQVSTPDGVETHHWEVVLRSDIGNVERAMLTHPAISVLHPYWSTCR